jgi:hypothetical protein
MKVTKFTTYLFLLSSIAITSCQFDSEQRNKLNGRWEMKYGEFNGQPAPALEKMFFQFEGKNMTTNFNEATTDETIPFSLNETKITKLSNPNMEFEIVSLTDSTLEMTTQLRGADFKLLLNHVK